MTNPSQPPPSDSDGTTNGTGSGAIASSDQIGRQSSSLEQAINALLREAAQPGIAAEREEITQNKNSARRANSAATSLDWKMRQDIRFFSDGVTAGSAVRPEIAKRAASAASSVGKEMGTYLKDVTDNLDKQVNLKGQLKEFDKGLSGASNCLERIQQRLSNGNADSSGDSRCFAISRAAIGQKARLKMTHEQIRKVVGDHINGRAHELGDIDRNNIGKGMRVAGWIWTAKGKIKGHKDALKSLDKSLKEEPRDRESKRKAVAAMARRRVALEAVRVDAIARAVSTLNLPGTAEERISINAALSGAAASLQGVGLSWGNVSKEPKNTLNLSISNESTLYSISQLRQALGTLRAIRSRTADQGN